MLRTLTQTASKVCKEASSGLHHKARPRSLQGMPMSSSPGREHMQSKLDTS